MNRRHLLKNISIVAFASMAKPVNIPQNNPSPTAHTLSRAPLFESIEELAKGVFFARGKVSYWENGNKQEIECNNGWIIFDDFVLVIDANFPAKAALLVEEIRKTTNKPIKYVFNTHHHGDHIYGNSFWARQGTVAIAHTGVITELRHFETGYYGNMPGRWEDMAKYRSDLRGITLTPPIITFTDKLVIEDKTRRVELQHLGVGHTKGDGIAWLPNEKILFAGDSCMNGPYNLFRDADIVSWIPTLDKMHHLQPDILVPGHGPLGNSNTAANQQAYFKVLYDWVRQKKAAANSLDTLKMQLPELRSLIQQDEKIKTYLIPEPEIATGFSLEAQTKKIFETIS
jgi:cyclase